MTLRMPSDPHSEKFAFLSDFYSAGRSNKQLRVQLFFQGLKRPRDVRLSQMQGFRGLLNAVVFCDSKKEAKTS